MKISIFKTNRIWSILLILSLALNAVLIGMIIGSKISRMNKTMGKYPALKSSLYMRALPHDDRHEIKRTLRENITIEDRRKDHLRYEDALIALRSKPFSEDALEEIMELQGNASHKRMTLARDVLLAHLSQISDPERAEFANRLERRLQKAKTRETRDTR
jgi:uncharacterized membrane protein